jgi:putative transposase
MGDEEKVMRGMHSRESAQKIIEAIRINYNYCRPHCTLGKTPAEAAGINLNLGENKVESLMRQAAVYAKDVQEPTVKGLGIRANKVLILNESDCIKVKPKGWMEKKEWREIHDILRVQGFNWLANGRDSCWIKLS